MQLIPLQTVPTQTLNVTLNNQACTISVYQRSTGLFFDLSVSNALIIGGVICLNLVKIVRDLYLGFAGDFTFYDTQGTSDPDYTGLGTRYILAYLELSDLAGAG